MFDYSSLLTSLMWLILSGALAYVGKQAKKLHDEIKSSIELPKQINDKVDVMSTQMEAINKKVDGLSGQITDEQTARKEDQHVSDTTGVYTLKDMLLNKILVSISKGYADYDERNAVAKLNQQYQLLCKRTGEIDSAMSDYLEDFYELPRDRPAA